MNPKKQAAKLEKRKKVADALFADVAKANKPRRVGRTAQKKPGSKNRRPRVSLCMIVKNEEKNLDDCLTCVKDLVDEMIIVDTGSSDRTREIAIEHGAKLFEFPWPESFSVARNESLRHATGEWIFWMDADDRIDEPNRQKLRNLFATLDHQNIGFLMTCRVLPGNPGKPIRVVDHTRLFRNHPKIRWLYRVHEQIMPQVLQSGGQAKHVDVVITHVGYQDRSLSQTKLERNLHLMQLDHKEHPDDPFTLYNLGRAHERLEQTAEAVKYWRRSLECAPPRETYICKLYAMLAHGYQKLGQRADMLAMCLAGLARHPEYVDLLFWTAAVLFELGDLLAAEASLLRLLNSKREGYLSLGDDPGIRGHKAHNLLGRVYRDMKRPKEAEEQWRKALAEEPNFAQSLLGLGQLFLDQRRLKKTDEIIARLQTIPEAKIETAVLKALRLAVAKDFAASRTLMEETSAAFPDAVEPLILLGRLYMREKDNRAAERVLVQLQKLDPNNAEARRRLARLRNGQPTPLPSGQVSLSERVSSAGAGL